MLGISYGELFLIVGAAAALIGPKDLPVIARTAGRLAGCAIGYVQVARGQFESVMHQSQARQVHKELQDTMAQLEAIRHEVRSISFMNPGPLTTRLVDNIASQPPVTNVENESSKPPQKSSVRVETPVASRKTKDHSPSTISLSDIHSQASACARLAESAPLTANSMDDVLNELKDDSGDLSGSDLLLEAVLEEEVARNAESFFFSEAQIQTKRE
ncbi:sec-independent protein translocase protein TatB-like isoform X2 [Salvia splendens]|uniref:sec-independent protein translocase protein TatB-like isoform X2 n=1 Tax=Salvia splendens TaxID=180675 RepID=UPI001C27BDAF|nr:sec-independent protein translocase protein TatB-like isoform X2 [Salvia splendens]XP_042005041.1 sec-independent protein translocase protein TatB-like isoform X2 [Salvia splendens]